MSEYKYETVIIENGQAKWVSPEPAIPVALVAKPSPEPEAVNQPTRRLELANPANPYDYLSNAYQAQMQMQQFQNSAYSGLLGVPSGIGSLFGAFPSPFGK